MILIESLLLDKILKTKKNANFLISLLVKIPAISDKLGDNPYQNGRFKLAMQLTAAFFYLAGAFVKRLFFYYIIAWLPWKILSGLCPLIQYQQELTMMYCIFVLSVVCGSIANTLIFSMSEDDYFLLKTAQAREAIYYFGKITARMALDFLFGMLAMRIIGIGWGHATLLALLTSLARPVGEVLGLVLFSFFKKIHAKKRIYDGVLIALAILAAYVCPYAFGKVSSVWYYMTHWVVLLVTVLLALVSLYIIWNYKRYGQIVRELVYMRRMD